MIRVACFWLVVALVLLLPAGPSFAQEVPTAEDLEMAIMKNVVMIQQAEDGLQGLRDNLQQLIGARDMLRLQETARAREEGTDSDPSGDAGVGPQAGEE